MTPDDRRLIWRKYRRKGTAYLWPKGNFDSEPSDEMLAEMYSDEEWLNIWQAGEHQLECRIDFRSRPGGGPRRKSESI